MRLIASTALLIILLALACAPAGAPARPASPPAPAPAAASGAAAANGTAATGPAAGGAAATSPPPLERLKIALSTVSASTAGLYVAQEAGHFARNGLDVELVNLGSGQPSQAALMSGEVAIIVASGASSVNALLAGAPVVMIGAVHDTPSYVLLGTGDIGTLEDLRGKTIGINRLGGAPHAVLRYLMRQGGVDVDREARVIQVGQPPERLAALRSGAIQATLVSPPLGALPEREQLRVLADTADLNLAYPTLALVVHRPWLDANRDVARRVLQGVRDGTQAFKSDPDLGMRTLRRWLEVDDAALLDETYTYYRRTLPDYVLPRPEGLQVVLDEVAEERPEARSLRPAELVDASLAAELR
jgi:NitT/TauT family transport system substrate-binding protein